MYLMSKTIVLTSIFALARCVSASNECPANQTISCESLRSSAGYTFTVPVPPSSLCAGSCEQGWYYQNGTFIVDSTPNASGKRLPVVVGVTPHNLTLSVCESLQWQLDCGKCKCFIDYTVTDFSGSHNHLLGNNTYVEEHNGNHKGNDLPAWSIVLIGITIVCTFIAIIIGIRVKFFNKPKPADVL